MDKKRFGFSLAEVLITLGILGIVAAMTIPMMRESYEKKSIIPSLKKAYSNLKQAFIASQDMNAEFDTWNFSLNAEDFYEKYMKGYHNAESVVKVSDLASHGVAYYNMDGTAITEPAIANDDSVVLILPDGVMLFVSEEANNNFKTLAIDVNGLKRPNIVGKDIFMVAVQKQFGLMPYGYADGGSVSFGRSFDDETLLNSTPYGCAHSGAYCTAYIMSNSWSMSKNYPR